MKRTFWWMPVWLLLAAWLGACGRPDYVSQESAIALARWHTPLKTVEETLLTPLGPRMWCLLGADKDGRPMAVWVRKEVKGLVYLDEGTSRAEAVSKAQRLAREMGYTDIDPYVVLFNPTKPAWQITVVIDEYTRGRIDVDFKTGEALPNPHDPWGKKQAGSP